MITTNFYGCWFHVPRCYRVPLNDLNNVMCVNPSGYYGFLYSRIFLVDLN